MEKKSINKTENKLRSVKKEQHSNSGLSDDALYLIVLAGQLKKILGPASLQQFLATGETVVFNNKAAG